MGNELESVCCREVSEVAAHVPEGAKCITSHPSFEPVCLNIYALQQLPKVKNLVFIYVKTNKALHVQQYRYTAYRQFVRWIWVWLGRRNRKVLPSCVVKEIRNAFPSE
nr:uncharacterized protein LOC119161622 [Rhipicephalus microplus]